MLQSPCMPITQLLHCHFSRPVTIFEYLFSWLLFFFFLLSSPWKFDRYLRLSWKIINSMKVKGRTPLALTPSSSVFLLLYAWETCADSYEIFPLIMLRYNLREVNQSKLQGQWFACFSFFLLFFLFYFDRYNQKSYLYGYKSICSFKIIHVINLLFYIDFV